MTAISHDGSFRCVTTADGTAYGAYAVLLALGSTYRRLGIPGEEDFIGAGVHFCATCDGPFYRGEHVAVIGGGNSAGEEGLFLTKFAQPRLDRHPGPCADGKQGCRDQGRRAPGNRGAHRDGAGRVQGRQPSEQCDAAGSEQRRST